MSTMLSIHDLKTYFYSSRGIVRAVDGITLELGEKQAIGLVGESGCGKTMTARSIVRLVPRTGKIVEGEILYKGSDLCQMSEKQMGAIRGKEISMVFQEPMSYLNPVMRVGEQVAEAILLHEMSNKKAAMEKAVEALRMVNLPVPHEVVRMYPHELSGGMKQRILIAMALCCDPSVLIADEPTTALDVTVQAQILDLIRQLLDKTDVSLLLITHDLGIVAEICDSVYVMYAGKIVEYGSVYAIFRSPVHPYTKGLLESVLSIDEFKQTLKGIDGVVPNLVSLPKGCRFHPRCPHAQRICFECEPPSYKVAPEQFASCWLLS